MEIFMIHAKVDAIDGLVQECELNSLYEKAYGVEVAVDVGVYKGKTTAVLCLAAQKVISVDDWLGEDEGSKPFYSDDVFQIFQDNMKNAGFHPEVMKMKSVEAAKLLAPESVDFVYIDADHSYSAVGADILAWLPKIRRGGIIGGHDWDLKSVRDAVSDILGTNVKVIGRNWFYDLA